MSKPFQFSMRRMFAAATLLCVAAFLFTLAQRARAENYEDAVELIASPVIAGAGIGLLFRRPMIGAFAGALLLGIPLLVLVYLLWGVCP